MSTTDEILELEERLRRAELGSDAGLFEDLLADEAIIDGQRMKAMIVEAHRAGTQQFMRVWHQRDGRWQIIAATTAVLHES